MTGDAARRNGRMLSAEEAFGVLGNETRLRILQVLGEADDPLSFSELFDRVDYDTTANFSYHLEKLLGHFVSETDDGYVLRQSGRRVIEAVLAEALAGDPVLERTQVETPCPLCGAPIEVSYRDEHVGLYCSQCEGTRSEPSTTARGRDVETTDVLGYLSLPPAGIVDRTAGEVVEAASVWTTVGVLAMARGVCPRCSAAIHYSVDVCEDHDATGGHCDGCGQQFEVTIFRSCTNCIFAVRAPFSTYLLDNDDLIGFMNEHDIDLLGPNAFHMAALEEEVVLSTDPFVARFTFTAEDDSLTLTVDDDLSVVDVTRGTVTELEGG